MISSVQRNPEFFHLDTESLRERSWRTFLFWLLSVEMTIHVKEDVWQDIQDFIAEQMDKRPMYLSAVHHRSHIDTAENAEMVKILLPQLWERFRILADKKTWAGKRRQEVAERITGKLWFFNRELVGEDAREQSDALIKRSLEEKPVLVIYPEGSRDKGRTVENLPVVLAKKTDGVILATNLKNNERVQPKISSTGLQREIDAAKQWAKVILRRIRGKTVHVEVILEKFLDSHQKLLQLHRDFKAAHQKADQPFSESNLEKVYKVLVTYDWARRKVRIIESSSPGQSPDLSEMKSASGLDTTEKSAQSESPDYTDA